MMRLTPYSCSIGGDPRILFLYFDAYKRHTDLSQGIGKENLINVSHMNRPQVNELLKSKGLKPKIDVQQSASEL